MSPKQRWVVVAAAVTLSSGALVAATTLTSGGERPRRTSTASSAARRASPTDTVRAAPAARASDAAARVATSTVLPPLPAPTALDRASNGGAFSARFRGREQLRLDGDGAHVATGAPSAPEVTLRLAHASCDGRGARTAAGAPTRFTDARGGFDHGAIREWYELRGSVVEQGFDVSATPDCEGGALELDVGVSGAAPRAVTDHVELLAPDGAVVAYVAELHVFDADGRAVPASFAVREASIAIRVDARDARFPLVVDPLVFGAQTQLIDAVGHSRFGDDLGDDILVRGDLAFVSAPDSGEGAVFVLRRTLGAWSVAQVLRPSDGAEGDRFGESVAYDAGTLLVGASRHESASGRGAAYVFDGGTGSFVEQQILVPTAADLVEDFGMATAVHGDVAVVTDPTWSATDVESAYVFRRTGGVFAQTQTLVGPGGGFSEFGASVALTSGALVVGSPYANRPAEFSAVGLAYVYEDAADTFTLAHTLDPEGAPSLQRFGQSVAIDGTRVAVAAIYEAFTGRVHVFTRATGAREATLAPPAAFLNGHSFGTDLHLAGDRLLASLSDASVVEFGASTGTWTQTRAVEALSTDVEPGLMGLSDDAVMLVGTQTPGVVVAHADTGTAYAPGVVIPLGPDLAAGRAGSVVATDGITALVASAVPSPMFPDSDGAVHVYANTGGMWRSQGILAASQTGTGFGTSAVVEGNMILVGEPGATQEGSVAVYARDDRFAVPEWRSRDVLSSPQSHVGNRFGASMASRGAYVAIGAPEETVLGVTGQGRVYVYEAMGLGYTLRGQLTAPDGTTDSKFGLHVSTDGTSVAVAGASGVYVSARTGTTWGVPQSVFPFPCDECAVAIDGALLAVGRPSAGPAKSAGVIDIYENAAGTWSLVQTLVAPDYAGNDYMGTSVALAGGVLLAGSPGDDGSFTDQGSVRVFTRDGTFSLDSTLFGQTSQAGDAFGTRVALRGTSYVVGAPLADFDEPVAGATQLDVGTAFVGTYTRGAGMGCTADAQCDTGFCVDGVCCNTECGRADPTRCAGCSVATGASADGTCTPRVAGTSCRAAAGVCDASEVCDGTNETCPADARQPAGFECRVAAGACDVPEVCDGVAVDCPSTDALVANGTVCRAASGGCDQQEVCSGTDPACPGDAFVNAGIPCRTAQGACDVEETCDGTSGSCPADAFVAANTPCRPVAGLCDVAELCSGAAGACPSDAFEVDGTACDDALTCTQTSACQSGVCAPALSLDCSDGDPCTTDACGEPSGCSHAPIAFCSLDAGVDAGTDSGVAPGMDSGVGPAPTDSGGCSCRVAGDDARTTTRGGGLGAFAALGLMLFVRRRRSAHHGRSRRRS